MPHIPRSEYVERLSNLETEVARAELGVYLVSSFDNIYYLTGAGFEPLERPFFLLVFPKGVRAPVLLVPKLDAEHMKKARNVSTILTYWEYPAPPGSGWADRLRETINSASEIGVEPDLRQEIVSELKGYSLRLAPLVEKLRLVKSPAEVEMIRRAAKYADFGGAQLLSASYRGATVGEGFARTGIVSRKIIREVDDWDPLTSRVLMATWAAPRSAQPHSIPDLNDRLLSGPHVALVLTRVNGYSAECERTYFTVSPSKEMKRAFSAMQEARRRAFAMIRPGVPCAEVDRAVNKFLRQEGFDGQDCRLHRTGHGFGLGTHEGPWLADGSADVLEENMVISIEPGIYLKGEARGGYRHSDTVLVTREGHELLTRSDSKLESLVIRGCTPLSRFKGILTRRVLGLDSKRPMSKRGRQILLAVACLVATLLVGVFVLSWVASEELIHPDADKSPYVLTDYALPGPEDVEFVSRDGVTLRGWFVRGNQGATVILAHGRGGDREWMLPDAEYLYRAGFSVLLFDFRHRGKSEGDQQTLGAKETWDIQAAVTYLKSRKDVDAGRIGVQGNSMGAAAAILAAAETPELQGVVAEIPFPSAQAVLHHTYPKLVGLPSFPFAWITLKILEIRTGVDFDVLDPAAAVNRIKGRPILLIDNLEDELFPSDSVEAIYEAAEEPKHLWQIPSLHGQGREAQPEEYEKRVVSFWRDALKVNEHPNRNGR